MSLPSELRVLCFQLSATPVAELPRNLPNLQRYILRCRTPLAAQSSNTQKADSTASSVLVHKFKTQLSSLLNGRSPEGRFAAVVLIKSVIEVGDWEVLRGAESWVRGLLSILGKTDPDVTKEFCIMTLTKIYSMTQQYPTLIREITTPTLPGFVTSCLNLAGGNKSPSLTETVFRSFATLLPRHTTIFRPFTTQICDVTRPYLAPTASEETLVPLSLQESARHLAVVVHQTAAKNGGGEEWGKAIRGIIKASHSTADNVFRAVVEDWEPTADYVPEQVDVDTELRGGGQIVNDYPPWVGVSSGTERLSGLIETITSHLLHQTSTPVCIPFGGIMDLTSRMLSVAAPVSGSVANAGGVRLHPGIDRDERDGLWSGLPQIHVATLRLITTLAAQVPDNFVTIASGLLEQILWLFPYASSTEEFRSASYVAIAKIVLSASRSFDKPQISRLGYAIRACCRDVLPTGHEKSSTSSIETLGNSQYANGSGHMNKDISIQNKAGLAIGAHESDLVKSAKELLPLLISQLPQHHLDISLRSLIERTAILSHDKNTMIASILNPFVGKNGKALASVSPHLARQYGDDAEVELLLRPRMPLIPSSGLQHSDIDLSDVESNFNAEDIAVKGMSEPPEVTQELKASNNEPLRPNVVSPRAQPRSPGNTMAGSGVFATAVPSIHIPQPAVVSNSFDQAVRDRSMESRIEEDVTMDMGEDDSSDESVHLTMQLDTDPESD